VTSEKEINDEFEADCAVSLNQTWWLIVSHCLLRFGCNPLPVWAGAPYIHYHWRVSWFSLFRSGSFQEFS